MYMISDVSDVSLNPELALKRTGELLDAVRRAKKDGAQARAVILGKRSPFLFRK
jgi:hypothetical protein